MKTESIIAALLAAGVVAIVASTRKTEPPKETGTGTTPGTTPGTTATSDAIGSVVYVPAYGLYPGEMTPAGVVVADPQKLQGLWIDVTASGAEGLQGRVKGYRYDGIDYDLSLDKQVLTDIFPRSLVQVPTASTIGPSVAPYDRVFVRPPGQIFPDGLPGFLHSMPVESLIIRVDTVDALSQNIAGRVEGYRLKNGLDYLQDLGRSPPFDRRFVYARVPAADLPWEAQPPIDLLQPPISTTDAIISGYLSRARALIEKAKTSVASITLSEAQEMAALAPTLRAIGYAPEADSLETMLRIRNAYLGTLAVDA